VSNSPITFRTLKSQSEGLYKEKGSKFIGLAVACYNEEQAKEYLEAWKKEHHQARHLCYAYRLGWEMEVYRVNDDGEPANSAGAPIFGQIQSFELSNVLIGVVRYYGGTKLGVGGLINAYRTAAKEAIENGKMITIEVFQTIQLHFEYDLMPDIMNWIKKQDVNYDNQIFELACSLTLQLPLYRKDELLAELAAFEGLNIKKIKDN
jgi:uncharacterized YigZ family protein